MMKVIMLSFLHEQGITIKVKYSKTKITFKNQQRLKLPISKYILKKQNLRRFEVYNLFRQIKVLNYKCHKLVTKTIYLDIQIRPYQLDSYLGRMIICQLRIMIIYCYNI